MSLDCAKYNRNRDENGANYIIHGTHSCFINPRSKIKASVIVLIGLVIGLVLFTIAEKHQKRSSYEDNCPNSRTCPKGVKLSMELRALSLFVEHAEAQGEHYHVDDEGQVHVNVDHAAGHFAHLNWQVPAAFRIIVDAKWDGGQKYYMRQDKVEDCDCGHGAQIGFEYVDH